VPTFTDKNLYTAWLAPTATQPSGAKANATGNVLISFDYLLTPESFNSTEEYRNAADIILIIESVRLKSFILAP